MVIFAKETVHRKYYEQGTRLWVLIYIISEEKGFLHYLEVDIQIIRGNIKENPCLFMYSVKTPC